MELAPRADLDPPRRTSPRLPKVRLWVRRYGVAELVGLVTAILGYAVAKSAGAGMVLAAYGATIGENVGYYGVLTVREFVHDIRAARGADPTYRGRGTARTIANLLIEFGPAEALDAVVVRPLSIGLATAALGGTGVVIGKIAADLVFYVPVVITFEVRRRSASQRPVG